jgi:hypothetical protein
MKIVELCISLNNRTSYATNSLQIGQYIDFITNNEQFLKNIMLKLLSKLFLKEKLYLCHTYLKKICSLTLNLFVCFIKICSGGKEQVSLIGKLVLLDIICLNLFDERF